MSMHSVIQFKRLFQHVHLFKGYSNVVRRIRTLPRPHRLGANTSGLDFSAEDDQVEDIQDVSGQLAALEEQFQHLQNEFGKEGSNKIDKERDRKILKRQIIERKYFKGPQEINLLTWDAKEQIRFLNAEYPDEWTVDRLAESFPTSHKGIIKILKSSYVPSSEVEIMKHDSKAIRNIKSLQNGASGKMDPVMKYLIESKKFHLLDNVTGLKGLPKPDREKKEMLLFGKSNEEEFETPKEKIGPFQSLLLLTKEADEKTEINETKEKRFEYIDVDEKVLTIPAKAMEHKSKNRTDVNRSNKRHNGFYQKRQNNVSCYAGDVNKHNLKWHSGEEGRIRKEQPHPNVKNSDSTFQLLSKPPKQSPFYNQLEQRKMSDTKKDATNISISNFETKSRNSFSFSYAPSVFKTEASKITVSQNHKGSETDKLLPANQLSGNDSRIKGSETDRLLSANHLSADANIKPASISRRKRKKLYKTEDSVSVDLLNIETMQMFETEKRSSRHSESKSEIYNQNYKSSSSESDIESDDAYRPAFYSKQGTHKS